MSELEDLARECAYSDEGGFDAEGNDLGSVDALIEYKNALEERFTAARNELRDLHKMLYPERYEPFDHVYWNSGGDGTDAFQWSADTIEWVAEALERAFHPHTPVGDSQSVPECENCSRRHVATDVCMLAALLGVLEQRLERKLTNEELVRINARYDDDLMWERYLGPAVDVLETSLEAKEPK